MRGRSREWERGDERCQIKDERFQGNTISGFPPGI